jgi:monoamine oxidase
MTDVLVVGAGLAGLTAARRLVEAGLDVRVLEARDRVGGRTQTRTIAGDTVDVGGQWIGPGQTRMYALVDELGLTVFPTPFGGEQVLDRRGQLQRYAGTIPKLSPIGLLRTHTAIRRLEKLAQTVPPGSPWTAPNAQDLDATTVAAWASRNGIGDVAIDLLRPVVRTVFGAEPEELSMLHLLAYASSAGGLMRLVEIDEGFQQDRLLEGAGTISERLADLVGRDRIELRQPVHGIRHDRDGIAVLAGRRVWRAHRVIVAVPLGIASRIRFDPMLPPLREALHQRVPMGGTVKVFAAYDRPFWRDEGLSGEVVCTDGPISVVFDNTAPDGRAMLLAFVVGDPARRWSHQPEARRLALVRQELERWFGPRAAEPVWMHEQDWCTDPFAGGCPISLFPPGTWTAAGETLRQPVGRIHWAGTETARRCTGFMEGAVRSGHRAADEILAVHA